MQNDPSKVGYVFGFRMDLVQDKWREDHFTTERIFTITATHPESGRRFAYIGAEVIDSHKSALRFIDRIESYQKKKKFFIDPANRDAWIETDPVYGSAAYQIDYANLEASANRTDRENEEFPTEYSRWLRTTGA